MKRKERKIILRIVNALASLVMAVASVYLFAFEVSLAAAASMVVAASLIVVPVVMAGESVIEIVTGTIEAFFHAVIDLAIGIFEAIANMFD